MGRNIGGVIAGAIAWMVVFYALAFLLAALWPDYGVHGRDWFERRAFTFTPAMACIGLAFWVLADFAAGWVAMKISGRRGVVRILAAILFINVAVVHLLLEWQRFPWWYNLGVVIPCVPAVLLGGRCVSRP
jgi:hypothetical protein